MLDQKYGIPSLGRNSTWHPARNFENTESLSRIDGLLGAAGCIRITKIAGDGSLSLGRGQGEGSTPFGILEYFRRLGTLARHHATRTRARVPKLLLFIDFSLLGITEKTRRVQQYRDSGIVTNNRCRIVTTIKNSLADRSVAQTRQPKSFGARGPVNS